MTYQTRTENSKDDWETPITLFRPLDKIFHFNLDAAADKSNTLCVRFLTDALTERWGVHRRVWCNPPFSMKEEFLGKALEERQKQEHIVFLLPNNARETEWWNDMVVPYADQVINLIGRVNFLQQGKASKQCNFPSCLVVYRPRLQEVKYGSPQEISWDWRWEKE
jgi:phage N-6-adenine-methyltransferase